VLADNRDLQPAENIVPVLRRGTAHRFGPGLLVALNALSARLSAAALGGLDAQVMLDGRAPRVVAERWVRAQGLAGSGRGTP
jgi:glycine betaine/choline ABC-type transport system substrate-binding protein